MICLFYEKRGSGMMRFSFNSMGSMMANVWAVSAGIGLGGFVGSLCRYGLAITFARLAPTLPIGTLAANMLGCLVIGLIMALVERNALLSPALRLALATGFCGGFTTMSSFIYEVAQMIRGNEYLEATLYLIGTLLLSILAFWAGTVLGKLIGGGA
jgi:CrcB protein